jgi:hypothetical protein
MTTKRILVVAFLLLVQNHPGSCSQRLESPRGHAAGYISCSSTPMLNNHTAISLDLVSNGTMCNAIDLNDASDDVTLPFFTTRNTLQNDDSNDNSGEDDDDYDYMRITAVHRDQLVRSGSDGIASQEPIPQNCKDTNPNCEFWAESGECKANPLYMHQSCQKSCGKCTSDLDNQVRRYVDQIDILLLGGVHV